MKTKRDALTDQILRELEGHYTGRWLDVKLSDYQASALNFLADAKAPLSAKQAAWLEKLATQAIDEDGLRAGFTSPETGIVTPLTMELVSKILEAYQQ